MKTKQEINNAGAIIIGDWPVPLRLNADMQVKIVSLLSEHGTKSGLPVYLLNEKGMISELEEMVVKRLDPKSTLFLYPGNSARYIRSSGFAEEFESRNMHAKRIWNPGEDPVVIVHSLEYERLIDPSIKTILVVDDVVSSGLTLRKVYERTAWKFPNATWYAAPLISRERKLPFFKDLICVYYIAMVNSKKVPINSIGALIEDRAMRENYFIRNFNRGVILSESFEKILSEAMAYSA